MGIHLDEFKLTGTHWIALYVNGSNGRASYDAVYFHSFGVEHIPKEIKKFIGNKHIRANIYRIQAKDSIMCGLFSIGFIDFMRKVKSLLNYTNLFSPYEYKKNYKIILKYFHELKASDERLILHYLW